MKCWSCGASTFEWDGGSHRRCLTPGEPVDFYGTAPAFHGMKTDAASIRWLRGEEWWPSMWPSIR